MAGAIVLIALGCGRDEPPAREAPVQQPAPASRGSSQNLAMGTGEGRDPQPFTLEQRLLDAVRRGDRPTIERALELGATVQAKDDLARSTVLLATKDAGDLELVRWLRAKGAPVDEPDLQGRTALSFAAEAGRLDLVRELVDDGAADDRRDSQQRAPLFHAVLGAHDDVVAYLLDRGANPNARDQFGDTPLMMACAKGFASTAGLLLQHGADPSIEDQEGRTAKQRSAPGVEPCLGSPAR